MFHIEDAPSIHHLGQEIILHIHALLKTCKYRHPKKSILLGYIEDICDGMKVEGLLRLANLLNIP